MYMYIFIDIFLYKYIFLYIYIGKYVYIHIYILENACSLACGMCSRC